MEGCSILQNPVINPQDIIVEVEPLPEFDVKLHVRMPAHCIEKITDRLVEGGLEQTDEQLVQILLKVSVDEALSRLERTPLLVPPLSVTNHQVFLRKVKILIFILL